jgi:hypothetical protein
MKLGRAIASMHRVPDGWVRVTGLRRAPGGLDLALGVYRGRKGSLATSWDIRCGSVREISISDLDGGGIRLYTSSHPAARQYSDAPATLRCAMGDGLNAGIGALLEAHRRQSDDWIPFDRYVVTRKTPLVIRGPAFLVRSYARALRGLRLAPEVSRRQAKRARRPLRVLHVGGSFVVAALFEALQSASGLSNNRMQLTKSAPRRSGRRRLRS